MPNAHAQAWITENQDLLIYLARTPYPLSTWQEKYTNGNWHLFKHGIKNHAYTNFVFQIPHNDYWVQIAGPKHRIRNIYAYNTRANSYWYAEIAKHWEFRNSTLIDKLEIVPTYQTISRYAYYLLLEKALEHFSCTHIRIAPTYLVHIAHYSTLLSDENYIVVQEHIPDLVHLKNAPHCIKDISKEAIIELFNIICATGYWNVKNGIYVDPDNNLVLLDYEQRNIENPEDFFYKDLRSFEECVYNGLYELAFTHLKPHCLDLYQHLLWLITKDATLPHSSLWPHYLELCKIN
ncbi:MAG: hypothetical protein AB7S89_02970 [Candidatus Babeliales bacterium]